MTIRLTEAERARVQGMARRPRSRKQLYRAEVLLALDEGRPIEEVARRLRVGIERVEQWIEGFEDKRLGFLAEPDNARPRRRSEKRAPGRDIDESA
jgi:transposase